MSTNIVIYISGGSGTVPAGFTKENQLGFIDYFLHHIILIYILLHGPSVCVFMYGPATESRWCVTHIAM